jgi:hypothetical protein
MREPGSITSLVFLTSLIIGATPAHSATEWAVIEAVVSDSEGGVLPGVTATLTDRARGTVRTAISNASGVFVFRFLPPGAYDLVCDLSGFSAARFEAVRLRAGQTKRMKITLRLAGVEETITVTGESPSGNPWSTVWTSSPPTGRESRNQPRRPSPGGAARRIS